MRRQFGFTVVLMTIFAACGGGTGTGAPTSVANGGPGASAATPSPEACAADLAINAGFTRLFSELPDGPPSGPVTPELKTKIKSGFDAYLAKPLSDFEANVPPSLAASTRDAIAQVRRFAETGDGAVLEDEVFVGKVLGINRFMFDYCVGEKSLGTAREFQFGGLPAQLKAGVNRISLTNLGTEQHNLVILAKKAGVTQSFDAILALPQGQAMSKTDVVAFVEAPPGESDYTAVDLKPGTYSVVCLVSKGSVGDTRGEGPPHFTLGMKQEVTVA
ncbi:MAG: hypothetical protein ACRDRT_07075 [Pseudonocardiaceae bacterium]